MPAKRWIAVTAFAGCLLTAAPEPVLADRPEVDDWVAVHVAAQEESSVLLEVETVGRHLTHAPAAWMYMKRDGGFNGEPLSYVEAFPTSPAISTSREGGGLRVALETGNNGFTMTFRLNINVPAGKTGAALFAIGSADLESFTAAVSRPDGASVSITSGPGAETLSVGSASTGGAALAVGPLGTGVVKHVANQLEGMAGAFEPFCNCVATWTGPEGREGTWQGVSYVAGAEASPLEPLRFAGPPGTWDFTWAGVETPLYSRLDHDPVLAVWAPVGDMWQAFENST